MDYITIDTLRKMKAVGFTYPEYEHFLNYGMLFYYNDDEYFIGGFSNNTFSDLDKEVAQKGEWLPEAVQLLEWLTNTDFKVAVSIDEGQYFSIQAIDTTDGTPFNGGGLTLADALAKTITKICKSNRRNYIPRAKLRLEIID